MDTPNIGMGNPEKKGISPEGQDVPEFPQGEKPTPLAPEIQIEPAVAPPPQKKPTSESSEQQTVLEAPESNRIAIPKGELDLEDVEGRPLNTVDQASRLQDELNATNQ